jgi:single-strand DNA-binding protein
MIITVAGNLTRDPEVRFTSTGKSVASFSVASSRSFRRGDQWEEETSFVDVTAWEALGENVAQSLRKGDRVIVTGDFKQDEYVGKDGETKRVWKLTADEVGASLKRATVSVERIERTTADVSRPSRQKAQHVVPDDDEIPF